RPIRRCLFTRTRVATPREQPSWRTTAKSAAHQVVKSPRETSLKYPVPRCILSMAQFVYLLHHAQALSGEIDHTRPLSTVGLQQAELVARGAAQHGAKPAVIWHSGKLRARQTAEAW